MHLRSGVYVDDFIPTIDLKGTPASNDCNISVKQTESDTADSGRSLNMELVNFLIDILVEQFDTIGWPERQAVIEVKETSHV